MKKILIAFSAEKNEMKIEIRRILKPMSKRAIKNQFNDENSFLLKGNSIKNFHMK